MNADHSSVTVQTRGNAFDDRIAVTLASILGNGASIDTEATGAKGSTTKRSRAPDIGNCREGKS